MACQNVDVAQCRGLVGRCALKNDVPRAKGKKKDNAKYLDDDDFKSRLTPMQ